MKIGVDFFSYLLPNLAKFICQTLEIKHLFSADSFAYLKVAGPINSVIRDTRIISVFENLSASAPVVASMNFDNPVSFIGLFIKDEKCCAQSEKWISDADIFFNL